MTPRNLLSRPCGRALKASCTLFHRGASLLLSSTDSRLFRTLSTWRAVMPNLRLLPLAASTPPLQYDPLWELVQQLNEAEETFEQSSHETDEESDAFHDAVVVPVAALLRDQPPNPTTVQGAIYVLSQLARDAEMDIHADWAPKIMKMCVEFLAEQLQAEPASSLRPFEKRIMERKARDAAKRVAH